jgi:hypothetical protein
MMLLVIVMLLVDVLVAFGMPFSDDLVVECSCKYIIFALVIN